MDLEGTSDNFGNWCVSKTAENENWKRSEGTEGEEQRWEGESGQEIKKLALVSSNLLIVEHYVLVKEIPGC